MKNRNGKGRKGSPFAFTGGKGDLQKEDREKIFPLGKWTKKERSAFMRGFISEGM